MLVFDKGDNAFKTDFKDSTSAFSLFGKEIEQEKDREAKPAYLNGRKRLFTDTAPETKNNVN